MISKLLISVDWCMLLIWGSSQLFLLRIVLLYCLFILLLIFQLHIYYIFLNCPTVLKGSVLFLLFYFLCISVWEDYIDLITNSFFSLVKSTLFLFPLFSFDYILEFPSLCLYYQSLFLHLVYFYH